MERAEETTKKSILVQCDGEEQEEMEKKNLACFFSPTQHHSSSSKHTPNTSLNTNRASLEETTNTLVVVGECRESILVGESREEISIAFGEGGNLIGLDGEGRQEGVVVSGEKQTLSATRKRLLGRRASEE